MNGILHCHCTALVIYSRNTKTGDVAHDNTNRRKAVERIAT